MGTWCIGVPWISDIEFFGTMAGYIVWRSFTVVITSCTEAKREVKEMEDAFGERNRRESFLKNTSFAEAEPTHGGRSIKSLKARTLVLSSAIVIKLPATLLVLCILKPLTSRWCFVASGFLTVSVSSFPYEDCESMLHKVSHVFLSFIFSLLYNGLWMLWEYYLDAHKTDFCLTCDFKIIRGETQK